MPRPFAKSTEYSRDIQILQIGMLTSRPIVTFSSRLPQQRNGGVTCSVAVYRAAPPVKAHAPTTSIRLFSGRCAPIATRHSGTDKAPLFSARHAHTHSKMRQNQQQRCP